MQIGIMTPYVMCIVEVGSFQRCPAPKGEPAQKSGFVMTKQIYVDVAKNGSGHAVQKVEPCSVSPRRTTDVEVSARRDVLRCRSQDVMRDVYERGANRDNHHDADGSDHKSGSEDDNVFEDDREHHRDRAEGWQRIEP